MARHSAGILLYRLTKGTLQVLLVHPGGPFWANKDEGSWSIPKGEHDPDDDPFECALREFAGVPVKSSFSSASNTSAEHFGPNKTSRSPASVATTASGARS